METVNGFVYITNGGEYLKIIAVGGFSTKHRLTAVSDINDADIFTGSKTIGFEISNEEFFKNCLKVAATAETTRRVTLNIAGDK